MFKFPVFLGDFYKLMTMVSNVGHGPFKRKDFGFCCLQVKTFQLPDFEKNSFLFPDYRSPVIKRTSVNYATASKQEIPSHSYF